MDANQRACSSPLCAGLPTPSPALCAGLPTPHIFDRRSPRITKRLLTLGDLWSAVSDDTGTLVERNAYTPYGEVSVLDADFSADADNKSDISNEHLYTGRRLDPETGLQLNRNRFYASGLGRWVNRDPIGYSGGTNNLYEYVGGMPVTRFDPDGLKTPRTTEAECCKQWASGTVGRTLIRLGVRGKVICCDGRKVSCALNPVTIPGEPPNGTAEKISLSCILEHEDSHKADVKDCDRKDCYVPEWKPGKDPATEECRAYKKQLKCLERKRKDCKGDPDCEKAVDFEISLREELRDDWCKKAGR